MSLPTPNYVLTEDYTYPNTSLWDTTVLLAGTFVRPINKQYLPKHILEDTRWNGYPIDNYDFCYTPRGILLIPTKIMRIV